MRRQRAPAAGFLVQQRRTWSRRFFGISDCRQSLESIAISLSASSAQSLLLVLLTGDFRLLRNVLQSTG
jgi:hypothetical protein